MDFYEARDERKDRPVRIEIYPEFFNENSDDLMIRGGDFYAVWDERTQMWSKDIMTIRRDVDISLRKKLEEVRPRAEEAGLKIRVRDMRSNSSGSWHQFLRYIEGLPDHFHQLDEQLTFQDTVTKKTDYVSKRLPYSICKGDISAYEELVSTLYAPEERAKFEWAIGSILCGDSKKIQKFIVFHGPMGSGKSTIMNLIEKLFGGYKDGYCAKINAQALVGGNVGFALTPFAKSPLVGIDQDSRLSRIEDNTILNQIVSHDTLQIDQKFKDLYESSASCFLFMGTNEPVKITNSKSGIIRRLIDVEPTGDLIRPESKYEKLVEQMDYELGAIAYHCLQVYKKMGRSYYSHYVPRRMMLRTDPFFNFMLDNLEVFQQNGGATAGELWAMYKSWCDDSGMDFKLKRFQVIDEAKNYFKNFEERAYINGKQVRNWFSEVKTKKFKQETADPSKLLEKINSVAEGPDVTYPSWLEMKQQHSLLDDILADCPAQYGDDKPKLYWHDKEKEVNGKKVVIPGVKTKLKDLDTSKTHYVQMLPKMIQIDLDKKNAKGEKDFLLNAQAVERLGLPPTYAEKSKSGHGIHLTYWYDGDPGDLENIIEEDVEVKVQVGDYALRRRVSECNALPIAHISSGLPLRRKKAVVNEYALKDENHLRNKIMMALRKEVQPKATRTSMMYIRDTLAEAREKGIAYDFSQLDNMIYSFAANSTHSKPFCLKIYSELQLRWPEEVSPAEDVSVPVVNHFEKGMPIVFFDVEVFKNCNIIVYKEQGIGKKCSWMINPKPTDVESLFKYRLVGFNNRGYDNHILWAIYIGYTPMQVYELSQDIIVAGNRSPFRDAPALSYTDVYDYCSTKQGLKKWEIELQKQRILQIEKAQKLMADGKTMEEAAEAVKLDAILLKAYLDGTLTIVDHSELDWPWDKELPEEMQETAARYCENDVLATEEVFNATQADFKAREILAEIAGMTVNDTTNQLTTRIIFGDVKEPWHQFNYPDLKAKFPGYRFEFGKSYFNDVLIGEGGRVFAQPGMYHNVKTFDVASMHPSSIIAENGFGPFTARFKELMDIRIAIKHKDLDAAKRMLDGKLAPYLDDPAQAKQLSFALKIAINSVYGLTAAKFQTKFKDPRNVDNWVAKRGALFMETLRLKVMAMGATVVHIKTDSIKIADPTPEVEQFILKYGKEWGYNFEVESIYDRICLVNDAVYIAKCSKDKENGDEAGHWTATGAQFQHPYVFKALFSKEPIHFLDLCETRTVKTEMYLDMNEQKPNVEKEEKELDKLEKELKKLWGGGKDWEILQKAAGDFSDQISIERIQKNNDLVIRMNQLKVIIAKGHDYHFVGRAGSFCPILPGFGGGELFRKGSDGKYGAVAGTKGYRWLEAETVRKLKYQDHIDMGYFRELASVAIDTIRAYGNFELFVSDDTFSNGVQGAVSSNPPWTTPCSSTKYESCSDCPHFYGDQEFCCKLGYNVSNQLITD